MAGKVITHNPWVFDGADEYEGWGSRAESTAPVFNTVKPFVDFIFFESGATGGTYDVRDSDGGHKISGLVTLGANEEFELSVGKYVDGIYIEAFGSDGQILVYHGQEA